MRSHSTVVIRASSPAKPWEAFPATRYLGSKRKLLGVLHEVFSRLEFETALDPFCGTGSVAYLLKTMGKSVTASDALLFNTTSARALVENDEVQLGCLAQSLVAGLPFEHGESGFIEQEFDGLFFEADENRFLDGILPRIHQLDEMKKALALHALGQACLAKRPYNLFHRANLAMRRRDVGRSFGNKATWDKPFSLHFASFATQADAAVMRGRAQCRAMNADVFEIEPGGFDLVYLDPPYVSAAGVGVDYLDYYHFLEGLCSPSDWGKRLLHRYRHKPLAGRGNSPWSDSRRIEEAVAEMLSRFCASILVISYRSDGIPSLEHIETALRRLGKVVEVIDLGQYTYALSRNRRSREALLVAR
jgi:adenine-specific DNA methylase